MSVSIFNLEDNVILRFSKRILNFGVTKETDPTRSYLINYLNALAVASIVVSLFSLTISSAWSVELAFVKLFYVLIGFISLYFNMLRKFEVSKILLILLIPTIQCYSVVFFNFDDHGAELTILPFMMVVPFMFESWKSSLVCTMYLIFLLIACIWSIGYLQSTSFIYNAVAVFLGVSIGLFILIGHLRLSARTLTTQNEILKEKNIDLEKLVAQNDLKSELLAILSHDLRGPVVSFNMLSEKVAYLLRNKEHNTLLDLADSFESSSKRLFKNMDKLLNWSISQRDVIKTYFQVVSIRDLIENSLDSFEHILQNKKISVDIDIHSEATLISDEHILSIILKNIIDNAIKYSPLGSQVDISHYTDGLADYFYVIDQGIGIDEEVVHHLNSRIFQKSKDGYGIGLRVSMDLVKSLKGSIIFEKGPVVGTRVTIALDKVSVT